MSCMNINKPLHWQKHADTSVCPCKVVNLALGHTGKPHMVQLCAVEWHAVLPALPASMTSSSSSMCQLSRCRIDCQYSMHVHPLLDLQFEDRSDFICTAACSSDARTPSILLSKAGAFKSSLALLDNFPFAAAISMAAPGYERSYSDSHAMAMPWHARSVVHGLIIHKQSYEQAAGAKARILINVPGKMSPEKTSLQ